MKAEKYRKVLLTLTFFVCLFVICSSVSAHAEVSYLGELCVFSNNNITFHPIPSEKIMKFGVLYYGDGHFVLNGSNPALPEPIQGTGMIYGNTFVATLVSSFVDATNTSFTVSYLVLNFAMGGSPSIVDGTITRMTFDLTQPTAQSKVAMIPIYITICSP